MRFSVDSPLYYQYGYNSDETGTGNGTAFSASAVGDLDGDGTASGAWEYRGGLLTSSGTTTARLAPTIIEPTDPEE